MERVITMDEPYRKIEIVRLAGCVSAMTWDVHGNPISYPLAERQQTMASVLLKGAEDLIPAWQKEKELLTKQMAVAEQRHQEAMAAVLELSEMLYGDGTETPLPELPEATP